MSEVHIRAALFAGRWIGETQGYDAPAHVWDISVRGTQMTIESRWENETTRTRMHGKVSADTDGFLVGVSTAVLVDSQHFIIAGWDSNDTRGGEGPAYDVVFSRPGLAELQATDVWQRWLADRESK